MGNSIARDDTEAGSNSPKRHAKRGDCAVEASAHSAGSARAAQRYVR